MSARIEDVLACDFYERPYQDCITAGSEVQNAEGVCGKCYPKVVRHARREALWELQERLQAASTALRGMKHQLERTTAKDEGVRLALSYVEEQLRAEDSPAPVAIGDGGARPEAGGEASSPGVECRHQAWDSL